MHFVSFFKINKITILPCGIFLLRANRLDKITGIKVLHYYSICMHLETDWFGMVHKYVYLPRWIKNKFIELSCLLVLYCLFCIIKCFNWTDYTAMFCAKAKKGFSTLSGKTDKGSCSELGSGKGSGSASESGLWWRG